MHLAALLEQIKTHPDTVNFNDVMQVIEQHYHYQPTGFSNGCGSNTLHNTADSNQGSCKIFAFARLNQLDEQETLACFGDYYRHDVLANPEGSDHANIRNFIRYGWAGIEFQQFPLTPAS